MTLTLDQAVLIFLACCAGFGAAIGMYVAIRVDLARLGVHLTQMEKQIDHLYALGRHEQTENLRAIF